MQKKDHTNDNSGNDSLAAIERKALIKKIAIWAGIIAVAVGGLAVLVFFAGRGGTPQQPVVRTNLPPVTEKDIITVNPEAEVTVIKYSDFQCPACASYNPMLKTLAEEYPEDIRIVYRHFPLSIHRNAKKAGQAIFAAWKLDKFEEMKDILYGTQGDWGEEGNPEEIFIGYAKDLGLDTSEFEKLMNSDEAKKTVDESEAEALSLGLNSTPSIFIGNQQVFPRNIDDFRILINAEIEKVN